jgi:VWFA-related protein
MAGIMYPLWSINDVLLSRDRRSMAAAIRSFTGRKYNYEPKNLFEERYVHYVSTIEAERIRNQVVFSALKGLIIRMGGLREGRKAIILVSEGFTNTLPSQVQYRTASRPEDDPPKLADPVARDPALQSRIDSQEFFQQSELMADLRSVYELANRYNTAIYAFDPRGLAASEFDLTTQGSAQVSLKRDAQFLNESIETLRTLADETDGRAIINTNDLDRGLRQIVRDSSAYYLLGYTSTLTQPDGKFHKINVRIKRPGIQVRARPGYLAMSAAEVERAVTSTKKTGPPPAVTEAFAALASSSARRHLIASWIGMSPGTNGKTKVSFVWNPAAPRPGARVETPATLSLIAGGANSDLFYRGRSLAPGRVEFEVPPGPVDLEIALEDANKEVIDRETRQIVVPSLGLGLTFSTPQVFRARTLPEFRALATNPDAVPSIEREFRRTDRLLFRVGAQSASGTPAISARMLNRDGGQMSTLPVTPAESGGLSQMDVSLAAIPPGDYLIEVTAKDSAETATTLVAFRVIP